MEDESEEEVICSRSEFHRLIQLLQIVKFNDKFSKPHERRGGSEVMGRVLYILVMKIFCGLSDI